jgi:hypothetical protein
MALNEGVPGRSLKIFTLFFPLAPVFFRLHLPGPDLIFKPRKFPVRMGGAIRHGHK